MSASARPGWMEKPRPLTQAAKALALTAVVLLVCVPFLVIVSTSLASTREVVDNGGWVLWPSEPTLDAYRDIFDGGIVTHALGVSAGVTIAGTLLSLACTVTLAYALSRPGVFGGKPALLLVLFTFLFPPGMIPSFLLVKELGLLDSYASLVLPVLVNVFNLVVLRGFFQSIPEELYEAARLDGAGDWRVLVSVVLPCPRPHSPSSACSTPSPTGTPGSTPRCIWRVTTGRSSRCCAPTWWPGPDSPTRPRARPPPPPRRPCRWRCS